MCLILFAHRVHPAYPLVVAANRDEWFRRPTAPAAFWPDAPEVFAGRDLEQRGTWLGVTRRGRFAALTNYRDPGSNRPDAPSRGALVSAFLRSQAPPMAYLERLRDESARYNGFSLLAGDRDTLGYFSNREGEIRELAPGLYGLSNSLLDVAWPKVESGKSRLAAASTRGPERGGAARSPRRHGARVRSAPSKHRSEPRMGAPTFVAADRRRRLRHALVDRAARRRRRRGVVRRALVRRNRQPRPGSCGSGSASSARAPAPSRRGGCPPP